MRVRSKEREAFPARRFSAVVATILIPCFGCGSDPNGTEPVAAGSGTSVAESVAEFAGDARVSEVRRALEAGMTDAAATLLRQLEGAIGVEGPLLWARTVLMEGDAVGALTHIERARALAPEDGRVLATEVEVLVVLDKLETAREKLRQAYKAVGRTAELERARGVLLLRTPGGGREGLTALETARALDPALPFTDFPSAQAHLLVGREAIAAGAPDQALVHALLAREYNANSLEFRELEAEARMGLLDYATALELYAALERDGRELGDTRALLHQRYGTSLLLLEKREEALDQYLLARALGLNDDGLGFGATLLKDEALRAVDRGIDRYSAGDIEAATADFRRAAELSPSNLEAWNHLGVCLFQGRDYDGAAEAWSEVLARAARSGRPLPDPVHLNLARAFRQAGAALDARGVLEGYLAAEPDGEWAADTRQMLERLDAEAASDG